MEYLIMLKMVLFAALIVAAPAIMAWVCGLTDEPSGVRINVSMHIPVGAGWH